MKLTSLSITGDLISKIYFDQLILTRIHSDLIIIFFMTPSIQALDPIVHWRDCSSVVPIHLVLNPRQKTWRSEKKDFIAFRNRPQKN